MKQLLRAKLQICAGEPANCHEVGLVVGAALPGHSCFPGGLHGGGGGLGDMLSHLAL